MKVFFLNPPPVEGVNIVREGRCMQRTGAWTAVWAPISMAQTAAVLREVDMEAKLVDCSVEDVDREALKEAITAWKPDLVVINTGTPSIESDIAIASLAKGAHPDAWTMAIGIHPSARPDDCFAFDDNLDMLVRGEPEYTIRDAALAIQSGAGLDGVAGLSYRSNGQVKHNQDRPYIDDLDELPYPAWDLIDVNNYCLPFSGHPFLLVATARGCPYACTMCVNKVYYGAKRRRRSPQKVVDEMEWVVKEFGVRDFLFWTESFTTDQDYAIETAEEIMRRHLDVRWVCNSRVDTVSPRLLKTIKKAGCWMIGYGIESGVQEVLDSMKKRATIAQAVVAVRMAHEVGLEVTGHCILGFPGETKETMRSTVEFTKFLKLEYAQFYCAVAMPGSKLFEQCDEMGWLDKSDWKYFEQNYSVITTPQLAPADIMAARDQAYREFYRQPHVILNSLKQLRSGSDMSNFAGMIKDFLTWV